jgi:hypothetical protein
MWLNLLVVLLGCMVYPLKKQKKKTYEDTNVETTQPRIIIKTVEGS